ncbi:MAG: hypothetical protein R2755_22475 [Acidimicrobiales bacterium]
MGGPLPGSGATPGFTTANEFVIPVGRPVAITLDSADVQHSFWLPDLAGKMDLYPGRTNQLVIQADHTGRYRGQCAELCGVQHANMAFTVQAVPPDEFAAYLTHHAAPSAPPDTDADAPARRPSSAALRRLPHHPGHRGGR